MAKRIQHLLADRVQVTASFISQLMRGKKHASAPVAKRLGGITRSDPLIWTMPENEETKIQYVISRQEALRACNIGEVDGECTVNSCPVWSSWTGR